MPPGVARPSMGKSGPVRAGLLAHSVRLAALTCRELLRYASCPRLPSMVARTARRTPLYTAPAASCHESQDRASSFLLRGLR